MHLQKLLKPSIETNSDFDSFTVLLDDVVQVFTAANPHRICPPEIEPLSHSQVAQYGMTWLKTIQRDRARIAMMLERFMEERFCCRKVPRAA